MAISETDWLEVPIPYIFGLFFRPKFPRFKIQDSQERFGANLESNHRIQDSRFPGTLWSKSWIQPQDSRFKIQDSQELFGANLESILNPGFKISCEESLGILNLESWIQDLLEKSPRESWILNLESRGWIQDLDSRFAQKSLWESWILNLESWIQDLLERVRRNLEILNLESIQLAMALATPLQVG